MSTAIPDLIIERISRLDAQLAAITPLQRAAIKELDSIVDMVKENDLDKDDEITERLQDQAQDLGGLVFNYKYSEGLQHFWYPSNCY